jgi:hypothetical protein
MMSCADGDQDIPPPPPSPPPPNDNSDTNEFDDENADSVYDVIDAGMNAKFMVDAEREAEERVAHAAFDTEQQHRREAVSMEEELEAEEQSNKRASHR